MIQRLVSQRINYDLFFAMLQVGPSIFSCALSLSVLACEDRLLSKGEAPSDCQHEVGGEKFAYSATNIILGEKGTILL